MLNLVPSGYTAHLLGFGDTLEELEEAVTPLEEASAEGSLMLMRVNLEEVPSAESMAELTSQLTGAGVSPWPGYSLVYVDTEEPGIYITWVKGFTFTGIIVGFLVITLLTTVIGGLIWILLPQPVKDIISMMITMVIVVMMMKVMTPMLKEGKQEKKE